ncbi:hypothetical protein CRUP_009019, partial [Coryphaenoides rupestris]
YRSGSDGPPSPTSAESTRFSCYSRGTTWDPEAEESDNPHFASELLINKEPNELPEGVDPNKREMYLSNMDFENLLGTNRADFLRLPSWRQGDMKKKAGLF